MPTSSKTTLAAAALSLVFVTAARAQTVDYSFTGTYNTAFGGSSVSLGYTGTFTITDPVQTSTRPAYAADVNSPSYAGIWAGTSSFYTGASNLQITFSNGATLVAPTLGLVVNNTTFSGAGAPYPLGLSVQMYTEGAATFGMTASMVCPNGSTETVCDDSGIDPMYRKGDASDQAVQRINGVYFAFWGAPLSSDAAGVPELASTFGAAGGGLGVYSTNALGQAVTTLTQFSQLSSVTTASPMPVPEPSAHALLLMGLVTVGWRIGRQRLDKQTSR